MRLTKFSLLFLILISFVQCDKTSPEEVKKKKKKKISDSLKKVEEKEKSKRLQTSVLSVQKISEKN